MKDFSSREVFFILLMLAVHLSLLLNEGKIKGANMAHEANPDQGGEDFRPVNGISDDATTYLFDIFECDYDTKSGVYEVDAGSDPDVVTVYVGPNTDLSDAESLVTEIEGRPVVYERTEDLPELYAFTEVE